MVVGAALLFSTGGAAIKATTLGGGATAGLRSAIAAVVLLALVPESRRGWSWRVLPVGLCYAATLVLFVHANKLTTSANAIFLQATAPAYLLLLGPLVLKEAVRKKDIWFTLALVAGMGLFFWGIENPLATAPNPAQGNVYAALSGLTYAFTLAGLRWQAQASGGGAALATVVGGNLLAALVGLGTSGLPGSLGLADAGVLVYLGVFQVGLAYVLLTRGMKQVAAFESSVLLLVEPVGNPIFTWIFHGEQPSGRAMAGGAIILLSTFWHVWAERKAE